MQPGGHMLRTLLFAGTAALMATLGTAATAAAHAHHHFHYAYLNSDGLLVQTNADNDDVVSVAEPVTYAPVQTVTTYQPAYVPVSDTIVTPYGYMPYNQNGYYQGYAYNTQYAYNPYYMAAAYGNQDPLSAAVVGTVLNAVASGGHVSGSQLIQSLIGGFLAAQSQQQYQQYYQPQYAQPQYYPQAVYYPQQTSVTYPIYTQVQQVVPVSPQFVPVIIRHREHDGDGDHGHHGDHGGNG